MALAKQEDVLFQLLFNSVLQARFCAIGIEALKVFQLDEKELSDFARIRTDALQIDSAMRKQLILAQLSKQLPLSMTLFSSLSDGMELLLDALDIDVMSSPIEMRTVVYAYQLQEKLFESVDYALIDHQPLNAILQCETAMCLSAATAIQAHLQQGCEEYLVSGNAEPSQHAHLVWAQGVNVALLPGSYQQCKQQLCPAQGSALWSALKRKPLLAKDRDKCLQSQQAQVLVSHARIEQSSRCDPLVAFKTKELNEGFARVFQYINGEYSSEQLLQFLADAGADQALLESVSEVFEQLIADGMLVRKNIS